jgi:hypothetical protein
MIGPGRLPARCNSLPLNAAHEYTLKLMPCSIGSAEFGICEGVPMNDIDLFLQLPTAAQAAAICFVACTSCLIVMLLAAPRRNCFFFRWRPETRFLALLVLPVLLIIWPIVLYGLFLKSRGREPDDLDFGDD